MSDMFAPYTPNGPNATTRRMRGVVASGHTDESLARVDANTRAADDLTTAELLDAMALADAGELDRASGDAAGAEYRRRAAELAAQDATRRAIIGAAPGVERVVGAHRFDRLPTFAELSSEARCGCDGPHRALCPMGGAA